MGPPDQGAHRQYWSLGLSPRAPQKLLSLSTLSRKTCRFAALGANAMRAFGRLLVTNARRCFALLANVLERGDRKRSFLLENAAGLRSAAHVLLLRTLLGVSLDDVQAFDRRHARFREHGFDRTALA